MNALRVLIAEDHAVVREGTREILARDPGLEVVGEAEDGNQALQLAIALSPDVVVLDLRLPGLSGIEVAQRLQTLLPKTRTLVLSAYDDDEYVLAAMDAGAAGYLLKTAHGSEVVGAIYAISRGEVVLTAGIAAKLLRNRRDVRMRQDEEDDQLTEREMEILRMAARGLRNKDIARALRLSIRTVEGHLSHVFAKLGVTSRTEAIIYGVHRGWYSLGEGV